MYAQMRQAGVVQLIREPNGLERYLILRHEQAREAMADGRLSKDPGRAWDQLRRAGYVKGERGEADYVYHIANTDPPDHTRLRRLISKAFTVRRIEQLRPRAVRVAEELVSKMVQAGRADLVEAFSHPLSVTIISEILGVPGGDRSNFRTWATAMLTAPDMVTEGTMSPQEGFARMRAFFGELIERKRAEIDPALPSDRQPDVISGLIAARDAEHQLTEAELVSTAMLLLSAGQEPTVNLINNGMLALLLHRDQLELLRDRPELLPSAVEEFLRYDPPVELSTMRVAAEDLQIDGTFIPAGSVVTIAIASTSRDERRFSDPDALDITRTDNPHLAFGHGIHHCIGAPLARMQAQAGIGTLLRLLPDIALGCAAGELSWRPTRIMRGLVELPVTFAPRSPQDLAAMHSASI